GGSTPPGSTSLRQGFGWQASLEEAGRRREALAKAARRSSKSEGGPQQPMPITLYVLKSRVNGRRYVGITNDLARRLREHRSGSSKSGRLLEGDFVVLHTEEFADHASARVRETWLKSGKGRAWLDAMEDRTGPAVGRYSVRPFGGFNSPRLHQPSPR